MFLKKSTIIIEKYISSLSSGSFKWHFLRLFILNGRLCLRRNLSVVLSLNDVKNNIVINYKIYFLNNGKYKDLFIVNNWLFFKDNNHALISSGDYRLLIFWSLLVDLQCWMPVIVRNRLSFNVLIENVKYTQRGGQKGNFKLFLNPGTPRLASGSLATELRP